jgi:hypothetical protein
MKKLQRRLFLALVLIGGMYFIYFFFFSSEAILDNVSKLKGYEMEITEENKPIELYIEAEWFQLRDGEEKNLNIVLDEQYNTKIILEHIIRREDDVYFSFTTDYALPYRKGNFLYNGILNSDGSITVYSTGQEFELINEKDESIEAGQTGSGPNSDFSFGISKEQIDQIENGFTVIYKGMYLYEYRKK